MGPKSSYTFTNIQANHTIVAVFAVDETNRFTINATAGQGGNIDPFGLIEKIQGESQKFLMFADKDFEQQDVIVDGTSQGPIVSYLFTNIQTDHAIQATFSALQYKNITDATEPVDTDEGIQMPANGEVPVDVTMTDVPGTTTAISAKITKGTKITQVVDGQKVPYSGKIDPPRPYPITDAISQAISAQGADPATAVVLTVGRKDATLYFDNSVFMKIDVTGIGSNTKIFVYESDGTLSLAGVQGIYEQTGQTIEPGGNTAER